MMFTPIIAGGAASTLGGGAGTSDSPLSVPDVTLTVARGASAPEPTGAPSISSVTDNGDGTLTILGSNFGSKAQAAPRFVDYVDRAYLNGTENTYHSTLADDSALADAASDPDEIYYRTAAVKYRTTPDNLRHAGQNAAYFLKGKSSDVGKPKTLSATGGDYEVGSFPRFYVAQWFRLKYDPGFYVWFRAEDADFTGGTPIAGEEVTFTDNDGVSRTARYVGVQTNGHGRELELKTPWPASHAKMYGVTLNFTQSGASVTYPLTKFDGDTLMRIAPGMKFMRCWDANNEDNEVRFSITSNNYYPAGRTTNDVTVYDQHSWPVDRYAFMEFWVDFEAGYAVNRIDCQNRGGDGVKATFDPLDPYTNPTSLNMDLFGFNVSTHGVFYEMEVESIYADRSLQRVYLGNAATFSACTHVELQRPTAWASDAVTAAKNEGALTGDMWAYVAGPDGLINETGVSV